METKEIEIWYSINDNGQRDYLPSESVYKAKRKAIDLFIKGKTGIIIDVRYKQADGDYNEDRTTHYSYDGTRFKKF